tara:strand:- start:3991 stop:4176 length:186 start_codon:yes stop_codon:yes gene_type:complete
MKNELKVKEQDLVENAIIFNVTGLDIPVLELRQNGDIIVKGKLVENDVEVVEALREFISAE